MLGVCIDEFEVHRGIVGTGSLVDVDIQPVVALHLQRCLHTRLREDGHAGVAPVHGLLHTAADLRELCLLGHLLLGVIVAREPPCRMVASHRKLTALFLDEEVVEVLLLGELITESDTIVIDAEADKYLPLLFLLL